jgi:hypothetical protein
MELRTLQAKDGLWLTQSSNDIVDNMRIYCHEIVLGANDSIDNWRDASDEEYNEWYSRMQAMEQTINEDGEEFAVFPE